MLLLLLTACPAILPTGVLVGPLPPRLRLWRGRRELVKGCSWSKVEFDQLLLPVPTGLQGFKLSVVVAGSPTSASAME
jgi:hypothetical protein